MKGYVNDIEQATIKNVNFRQVIYTGKHSQLVLMSLKPKEEIGQEVHEEVDQFFRFEKGEGRVIIDGAEHAVKDGSAVVVPAGAVHNVINASESEDLKLYSIYSPANHKDMTVHSTKQEAEQAEEDPEAHFDGVTTE